MAAYGPQGWWPAGTAFEMVVGAILTQNTNWKNVERAIANLKPRACSTRRRCTLCRSSIWPRSSARPGTSTSRPSACGTSSTCSSAISAATWMPFLPSHGGPARNDPGCFGHRPRDGRLDRPLRGQRPVFVVDAYTARIFYRHGLIDLDATYEDIQCSGAGGPGGGRAGLQGVPRPAGGGGQAAL